MIRKPKFTPWLMLTLIFGFIALLFIMNIIEPFPGTGQAVVSTEYDTNGQTIYLDTNGNQINKPFAPNYVGNVVKGALVIVAIGSDIMLFRASLLKFS